MRIFIIIIMVFLLAGGGGGLYYLYAKNQEKDVIYETEKPGFNDIVKKTVATGSVVPRKEVEIKPQVSGLISKLMVEPGDQVKSGDLIARITIIPDMVTLNNAESRVKRAQIALDNANKDFERNVKLFKEGVIPEANYQQFEVAQKNAEEELIAAKDNLELIQKGSTQRSRNTGNTNVRATIAGMILDVPIEQGNSVIEANTFNDGTTIATVADMNEMVFEGKVDESEVGKIKIGMALELTIGAIENEVFDAELEYISPKGVEENGAIQFEIRAALKLKANQFIRAGYSANADIVLARKDSVLSIPESLLVLRNDSSFVEVEQSTQNFKETYIETGLSDGITIEVLSGVDSTQSIKNPNAIVEEKKEE